MALKTPKQQRVQPVPTSLSGIRAHYAAQARAEGLPTTVKSQADNTPIRWSTSYELKNSRSNQRGADAHDVSVARAKHKRSNKSTVTYA